MHILLGVLGSQPWAADVFDQLLAATSESNPGAAITVESGAAARLGIVSRSFAAWHDTDADRSFYLDGEVRSIDGRETSRRGVGEDDLASLSWLYATHGSGFWERLDGSFCLIVRDGSTWRIGVDVAGTRAVYWWYERGVFAFHSHLVDLAPSYPGTLTEDLGALGNFLACGRYPPGRTAYAGIRHLGAGQCASVVAGEVEARDHFRMVYRDRSDGKPTKVLVEELIDHLATAIARSWRAAVSPVVPLSGGMDSRYLTAELVRQAGSPGVVRTITWGENPARPGSDAAVAVDVAAALGVENVWHEKLQRHTPESFERAIYLSSGEADHAIHYPNDHILHAELSSSLGFASLFRGDEMFGPVEPLMTNRAVLASREIVRLSRDRGYIGLLDRELLDRMAIEQGNLLDSAIRGFGSRTPTGRSGELLYTSEHRRELAPYNAVKLFDLEVYTPFMDREILEWVRGTPDQIRSGKALLRAAMLRRFPDVAAIPFASRSNLPAWGLVIRHDPRLFRFLRDWCSEPGWLDTIGAQSVVVSRIEGMAANAAAGTRGPDPVPRRWRQIAKQTAPGRLLRELTLERRSAAVNLPPYLRVARLAVLHGLLGRIERRHSRIMVSAPGPAVRRSAQSARGMAAGE